MKAEPGSIAASLQADYARWFAALQALTDTPLDGSQWTGRWYDGFTPSDALKAGPDED